MEETGHVVSVHEFLGLMSYSLNGKMKIVQFWHMRTAGEPVREPTYDIKTVKWLPLKQAIDTLTRVHEKVFLASVGPVVLKAKQSVRDQSTKRTVRKRGQAARDGRRVPASREHLLAAG
jgi:8-oxo-dGTP diphosphatase